MVLVQNWPIFNLFSLDNLGQENVAYDILNRKKKNTFLRYKNKKLKISKNRELRWFLSKTGQFLIFFH